jgi:ankyrin repeat protein
VGHLAALRTPADETAVDVALRYGRDRAAEALLRSGAIPSDPNAWPPLHDAARTDAVDRVAILISDAADTGRTFRGKSPLEIAHAYASRHVEALLRERSTSGASP